MTPRTMKAFIAESYGKDSVPRLTDLPMPELGAGDVLVRIHAASVNPLDLKTVEGEFKQILPYTPPFPLGNDFAGVVEQVGAQVTRFAVDDTVYARPDSARIGAFAEYIAIAEDDLARMPRTLSMVDAASLPLVTLTAWQALVERARVQPGQKVLIHAGSGGVGTIAIQLAKHLGAYVATTTSTANSDWVRALGADEVIDYRTTDFADVLHDYDVVLDSLGADNVLNSLRVLRPGGIAISIGGPPDPALADQLGKPLLKPVLAVLSWKIRRAAKKRGVRYSFLFMRADGSALGQITDLVEAGVLRPVVDKVFPFTDALDALAFVASGRAKGKVALAVTPSASTTPAPTSTDTEDSP